MSSIILISINTEYEWLGERIEMNIFWGKKFCQFFLYCASFYLIWFLPHLFTIWGLFNKSQWRVVFLFIVFLLHFKAINKAFANVYMVNEVQKALHKMVKLKKRHINLIICQIYCLIYLQDCFFFSLLLMWALLHPSNRPHRWWVLNGKLSFWFTRHRAGHSLVA